MKLKLLPRTAIKLRVLPRYPVNVVGGAGISVATAGGNLVISVAMSPFALTFLGMPDVASARSLLGALGLTGVVAANDVAIFSDSSGSLLKSAGASLGTLPTAALPNVNFGHKVPILDTDVQFGGNSLGWVTGGSGFSGIVQGSPNCSISGTPTATEQPGVRFQWGANDITIKYTVQGGDTNNSIAQGLVNAINANATIAATQAAPGNGIFAYYLGGANFNIQWHYSLTVTLTASNSAHTTVTIPAASLAIDAVVLQLGRTWAGRAAVAGDTLTGLDWTGPNATSAGALATHWAQIVPYIANPAAGATGQGGIRFHTGSSSAATGNNALARMALLSGLVFYDATQALAGGGDIGAGTINLPLTGGLYIGGGVVANQNGLWAQGANLFGGALAGSVLNLASTSSGAPAGDFVVVSTGGAQRWKVNGSGHLLAVNDNTYDIGAAGATRPRNLYLAGAAIAALLGPVTDGTAALKITKADLATAIVTVDTTNQRIGINKAPGAFDLDVNGAVNFASTLAVTTSVTAPIFKASAGVAQFTSGANVGVNVSNTGTIGLNTASPLTQFHVHIAANQNSVWVGGAGTAIGGSAVGIWSINDAGSVINPMELRATSIYIRNGDGCGFSIGTTTNPGEGALLAIGSIKSNGATAGLGYATGAGGTVTQATSKATAVTLNTVTGAITMNAAALTAATIVTFVLNDTAIAATDQVVVTHESGGTLGSYTVNGRATGAGTAAIDVRNNTAGSLSEALVLRFSVIKSVNA